MQKLTKVVLVAMMISLLAGVAICDAKEKQVVMTFATKQETMTFDPAKNFDETQCACIANTYDTLVRVLEAGKPIVPWLAEAWDISKDGKTYTFHLRKGVRFHDGTELTAEDVAFSLDRMLRIKRGFFWIWADLIDPGDVKVIGKYTVAFPLKKAFAPFVTSLVQLAIVNKDLVLAKKKKGDFGEFGDYGQEYLEAHDAGSGAYIAANVILGDRITFKKFDDYWHGWKEGQVEVGQWIVVPESATIAIMMKNGDIEITDKYLTVEQFEDLAATPGVVIATSPRPANFCLFMNVTKPPLDDVNVRRAISYAFDYQTVLKDILKAGIKSVGPVPVKMPGHNPKTHEYYQDLELAKLYLKQSKYNQKELQKMTMTYRYVNTLESERLVGLLLADNLSKLGLKIKIQGDIYTNICADATKSETTAHITAIFAAAKYPHSDMHTYMLLHPGANGSSYRTSWYENPVVTQLIERARTSVDIGDQNRLYGEVQRISTEEAPAIFIANPPMRRALRDYVKGYPGDIGVNGHDLNFYNFRIEK